MKEKLGIMALISEDYRQTGRCNAVLAKKSFGFVYATWAIPKHNSKYEAYQRGYRIVYTTI